MQEARDENWMGGVRDPSELPPLQRAIVWIAVAIELLILAFVMWQIVVALTSV